MQKTIKQILDGKFNYDSGVLDFSCTKIEIVLNDEEIFESSFSIRAPKGEIAEGTITTSDRRMECLTTQFHSETEEILYRFHSKNIEEGDVVKGEFHIVSDLGEYSLPFVVSKIRKGATSSLGPVKNLFHFANLAQTDWKEALQVFYSPDFEKLFYSNDKQYLPLYKGLSSNKSNAHNMDEFLCAVNKKRPVRFEVDEKEIHIAYNEELRDGKVEVQTDGWGYIEIDLKAEGGFLKLSAERICGAVASEEICVVEYTIIEERLVAGSNRGKIIFKGIHDCYEVNIVIDREEDEFVQKENTSIEFQKSLLQLMQLYVDVKKKNIPNQYWKKESLQLVEQMTEKDDSNLLLRLFHAQLFITMDRINEAELIMEEVAEAINSMTRFDEDRGLLEAYYLYLSTLLKSDEEYVEEVVERVRALYMGLGEPWKIGWLLLYLAKEYEKSASLRYNFLEKQIEDGCVSPIMYMEILNLINVNPSVIRRLTKAKLRVIYYAARHDGLSDELLERILYLIPQFKEYSGNLLKLLIMCYEENPRQDILKEICGLLIKAGRTDSKYLHWYEKGIKEGLRITNLYEYYMSALDPQKKPNIPREVLLYYVYQDEADYRKSAYLYSYVINHKNEYWDIYESYHKKIRLFVLEQVQKMRIDKNLAFLYREFLTESVINEQNAEELSCLIFSNMVTVDDPNMTRVIVCYKNFEKEFGVNLQNQSAWIPIFGNEYCLLLEDKDNNRYVHSVEYRLEKLLLPGKYVHLVSKFVTNQPLLDMYAVENMMEKNEEEERREARYLTKRRVYECRDICAELRNKLCVEIMQYLYDEDRTRELDEFFGMADLAVMNNFTKMEMIRFMVIREKYDKAYEILQKTAIDASHTRTLVRLIGYEIKEREYVKDETLLDYCKQIFAQGKYDDIILRYLCMHYEGKVKDMRSIWKAAMSFEEDCLALCERMLLQMLVTGAFVGEKNEIFEYYLSKGGKPEVEKAYLSQNAYDYFVKERIVSEGIFKEIGRLYRMDESIHKVCKLAFIKYYSENPQEADEGTKELAVTFIREMMRQNIYLNCFKEFGKGVLNVSLEDKTILEYHGHPDSKVTLHYLLQRNVVDDGDYKIVEMRPVYGGVYYMDFVLFFGENIQYYIVEEKGDREELTESGTLQRTDMGEGENEDRYSRINDLVISNTLREYDGLEQMLEEFNKLRALSDDLFQMK